jgi:proline iminopeptidase
MIYVEESGNPQGMPIIFLHGGPGGGTDEDHRRFYDPSYYRIILFDQRGCGKSTPFAEIKENTTWDLVEDMEKIRNHLHISKWILFGGSWGSTLALAYAIKYPNFLDGLVLRGIFLCRSEELQWFYQNGASWIFPEQWDKYKNFIPRNEQHDFIAAYYKRLTGNDKELQLKAAQIWSIWEASTSKLYPSPNFIAEYEDPNKALPFARIECHYFINKAFFSTSNFILDNLDKIKDIPTYIVQGRYDVVCPMKSAWELHQGLPKSQLHIISDAGHSAYEVGIRSALITATQFFKEIGKN